jgi:putative hydrolase of HD superfamily
MLSFLHLAGSLKLVQRQGWIHSGVPGRIESVADHSWRVALLAVMLGDERAVKMALLHDLQEALVGDIIPESKGGVSVAEKHAAEREAVKRITEMLPADAALREELPHLFEEYEQGTSPTAVLVKDLDKAEMLLQAAEYEKQGCDLQDFFDSTVASIQTPRVRQLVDELVRERKTRNKA